PFRVVYNRLDLALFTTSEHVIENVRQRLDLAARQVVLFGGRITESKGSKKLLAALNRIKVRVPSVLLLVLKTGTLEGHGFQAPEFTELREHHIRLGGWLSGEELVAAYRLADVITLPSIHLEAAGM